MAKSKKTINQEKFNKITADAVSVSNYGLNVKVIHKMEPIEISEMFQIFEDKKVAYIDMSGENKSTKVMVIGYTEGEVASDSMLSHAVSRGYLEAFGIELTQVTSEVAKELKYEYCSPYLRVTKCLAGLEVFWTIKDYGDCPLSGVRYRATRDTMRLNVNIAFNKGPGSTPNTVLYEETGINSYKYVGISPMSKDALTKALKSNKLNVRTATIQDLKDMESSVGSNIPPFNSAFGSGSSSGTSTVFSSGKRGSFDSYNPLIEEIKSFLSKVSFRDFVKEIHEYVKGQDREVGAAALYVYNYLESVAKNSPVKHNFMITAPSGCGKTQFYRALRGIMDKYNVKLPVVQIDTTSITEEGFKGNDTEFIIKEMTNKNRNCKGVGIIFLDELDKKMLPSYTSGGNDVNAAVQSQLLTLIEGTEKNGIDTNKTLFIGMGAFQDIRDKKTEEHNAKVKNFGFGLSTEENLTEDDVHYSDISMQDIIEYGCKYEFAGRFTTVINFHKLTKDVVEDIIRGYIKDIKEEHNNVFEIEISDAGMDEFVECANGLMGCRFIANKLVDTVSEAVLDIRLFEDEEDFKNIVISVDGVNKASYEKREKVAKKSGRKTNKNKKATSEDVTSAVS